MSNASSTIEIAGVLCDRKAVTLAIRRHAECAAGSEHYRDYVGANPSAVAEGESLRGQHAIAALAGVNQSTVSRRLRSGGTLGRDGTGRAIESAILAQIPSTGGGDLRREYGAMKASQGSSGSGNAGGSGSASQGASEREGASGSATAEPNDELPPEDARTEIIQRLRQPIADVRGAIRDGTLDSVFGVRKAALVCQVFGALVRAGWSSDDALASAWYTGVVAKEPEDTRLHVVEPFVSEFGFDPEPPQVSDAALRHPSGDGWLHPVVPLLAALLRAGVHVWLYGEAGCGKSRAARDAAELIGRSSVAFACHKHVHVSDALGGKELIDGNTVTRIGPWPHAMRQGSVLILEEPTKTSAGVLAAAHSMLEERELTLPFATGDGSAPLTVEARDGFAAVACDNAEAGRDPGRYAEVSYMDPAFLDRWCMLEVNALPDAAEEAIMQDALTAALSGESAGARGEG